MFVIVAITAQLRALADQQKNSAKDAARMAAEQVAAKLNQSIGMMGGGGGGGAPPPQVGAHAGLGLVTSEDWSIPNRVVGLGMFICQSISYYTQPINYEPTFTDKTLNMKILQQIRYQALITQLVLIH